MGANKDVVGQAYAAFGAGDIPTLIGLLDDGVDWSSPKTLPQGGTFRGKDGVVKFFEGVGAAWDSLQIDAETVDELGSGQVVGVVRGSGTLQGGRDATYGASHVFDVRDGKITRFREYVDIDDAISA